MCNIIQECGATLKKHITLCNVSKKYTFEKMTELLPQMQDNFNLLNSSLLTAKNGSTDGTEIRTEKITLLKLLSINRILQKLEELDALKDYLSHNLIVSIASSYDIYLSTLLKKIIINKKMFGLIPKQLSLCDILRYSSQEELSSFCVEEKISDLMRKSHKEQITWIEKSFCIDIINSFSEWKSVFEFFQIRNIIVHNDGIVNRIFIDELRKAGISSDKYKLGDKIKFNTDEVSKQIRCIIDFSVYIFSLLLRKFYKSDDELNQIDGILNGIVYDFLCKEKYTQVTSIVDNILKANQRHNSAYVFMLTINKCIALKNNHNDSYAKILEKLDWSNCETEYKVARAVLLDEIDEACKLMESLEKEKIIPAYVEWPLFKDFIKTDAFKKKFREIYGTDFEDTLSELSGEKSQYLYDNKIIEPAPPKEDITQEQKTFDSKKEPDMAII